MPDEDDQIIGSEEIKSPAKKNQLPLKLIILGAVGYISVFVLMMAGMVMLLKPDAPPLINPTVFDEAAKIEQTVEAKDPDVSEPTAVMLEDPANVDISELVDELKEIEYRSRLRDKMEQDSVARILAERETKIAEAKLEKLKLATAKIISARPKSRTVEDKFSNKQESSSNVAVKPPPESKKGYKQLAKIYESMKPNDAAKILDKMESSLVVNLLTNMKNRNAAKILSSFKPVKAARISKQMSNKLAQI